MWYLIIPCCTLFSSDTRVEFRRSGLHGELSWNRTPWPCWHEGGRNQRRKAALGEQPGASQSLPMCRSWGLCPKEPSPPLPSTLLCLLFKAPGFPPHRCMGAETLGAYWFGARAPSGSDWLWFNTLRIGTSGTLTSAQHRKSSLGYHPEPLLGHFPQRLAAILPRPISSQVDNSSLGLSHLGLPQHTGKLKEC